MLSIRHSIGKTPLLEHMANAPQSVAHFPCYAIPPPTGVYAPAKVKVGAQFFTDAYNIYHFTEANYDHRTVNHGAGEYARRDPDGTCVHCNTMEGIWSGLRNFLDHFKGISQRFLHLRVARYEFLHNHGHLHWRQTFEAALRCIFSTTGGYLRRMTHQHRRMPLGRVPPACG